MDDDIGIFSSSSHQDHSQSDAMIVDVMGVCFGGIGASRPYFITIKQPFLADPTPPHLYIRTDQ